MHVRVRVHVYMHAAVHACMCVREHVHVRVHVCMRMHTCAKHASMLAFQADECILMAPAVIPTGKSYNSNGKRDTQVSDECAWLQSRQVSRKKPVRRRRRP